MLCLPGAGELDEALANMIAHLVERRGFGGSAERAGALSLSQIFSLDMSGKKLVCLCYLEDVPPAQLRYALRRLKRKAPQASVVVSPMGETMQFDEEEVRAGIDASNIRFVEDSLDNTVDAISSLAATDAAKDDEPAGTPMRSASSA